MAEKKKNPTPEEAGSTIVCANKQTVNRSLQEFQSGVKIRLVTERKKALNRKLRDENIRISEERGREDLAGNSGESIKFNLTPAEIREKLRGGQRGRKEKP